MSKELTFTYETFKSYVQYHMHNFKVAPDKYKTYDKNVFNIHEFKKWLEKR